MDEIIAKPAAMGPSYEEDPYAWALHQAELLYAGRLNEIDAANIAEELRDVASAEYDKLESALRVLLMHMLKWDHQPSHRGASWEATIVEQRNRFRRQLRKSPSLKSRREEALADAYEDARTEAAAETGLRLHIFPEHCPYSWHDILHRSFDLDRA
jgi:hypothetical protein